MEFFKKTQLHKMSDAQVGHTGGYKSSTPETGNSRGGSINNNNTDYNGNTDR